MRDIETPYLIERLQFFYFARFGDFTKKSGFITKRLMRSAAITRQPSIYSDS